jgi:hypothetical protein
MRARGLLAVLAVTAAAGCGSSSSATPTTPPNLPNIPQVEAAIAQTILADDHVTATVVCPTLVPQIVGETFSCVAVSRHPRVRTFVFQATERGGTLVAYRRTA